jgi:predicted TIM-barrel fold metal-dependent hydrolase
MSDANLLMLHAKGVRGLRVNLVDRHDKSAILPAAQLQELAIRIEPLGWHLELLMHADKHATEFDVLTALPVPVVLGHFGYQSVGKTEVDAGFLALLDAMRSRQLWIKMTGPYRLTTADLPYEACDALVETLLHTAPDRLLWGSDWPHVMLKGRMPNDADLVDLIERWLPDPELRRQVLVSNPEELYGFAPEA